MFLNLKFGFVLANSADPDEMPHDAAFHQGLHCLPNTHLGVTSITSIADSKSNFKFWHEETFGKAVVMILFKLCKIIHQSSVYAISTEISNY